MVKWRMRIWCALLTCISIVACAFLYGQGQKFLFFDECVACTIYGNISEPAYQNIQEYLSKHKNVSAYCLMQKVQEEFPFLQDLSLCHLPSHVLQCVAHLQRPLYMFNNEIVMTDAGCLASKQVFDNALLHDIPHFNVDDSKWLERERQTFFTTISSLQPSVWQQYVITFKNEHDVWLYSKSNVMHMLRFRFEQIVDARLFDSACKVLQDFYSRSEKKSVQKMVIDMRFDSQVVLYEQTGRI